MLSQADLLSFTVLHEVQMRGIKQSRVTALKRVL